MRYFDAGVFEFLKDLKHDNDRAWFNANKERYEQKVKETFLEFIALRSVYLSRWRSTSAATIASSRGPAIGMNSGTRSIGDAIQMDRELQPELGASRHPRISQQTRKSTSRLGDPP